MVSSHYTGNPHLDVNSLWMVNYSWAIHPYTHIPLFQVFQDMAQRHYCANTAHTLQPFLHLWRSHSFCLGMPPKPVVHQTNVKQVFTFCMSQTIPHTRRFLLIHIIIKYDNSSSVSCMLIFMKFHMQRSWETQYSSIGTVLASIPLNVTQSPVSRETQKEATLIHSSIQREFRLRPLLVECCKKPLSLSSSNITFTPSWYGFPSSPLIGPPSCVDHKAQGIQY